MSVEIGSIAPEFELKNTAGELVKLSEFRGKKVVLMFFPFAFTGTCTAELCAIRDNENEFIDADTVVVSISCDSHYTLKNFQEQEHFKHLLLSDFWPHGEVSRKYGVFLEERGMSSRGTFIIDREGIVRWTIVNSPANARSTADYKAQLALL